MSYIGTVGVVAQQGNQAAVPTGVSIATSSSGNYDESFIVTDGSGCNFNAMDVSAQQWTSNALTFDLIPSEFSAFDGCASETINRVFGYLRATGATSYSWDLQLTSQSLSNSCVATIEGTAVTTQDCTGGFGVGEYLSIAFGGGRGGQTYPANGDSLVITLTASATNSNGSTAANNCVLTYTFTT